MSWLFHYLILALILPSPEEACCLYSSLLHILTISSDSSNALLKGFFNVNVTHVPCWWILRSYGWWQAMTLWCLREATDEEKVTACTETEASLQRPVCDLPGLVCLVYRIWSCQSGSSLASCEIPSWITACHTLAETSLSKTYNPN